MNVSLSTVTLCIFTPFLLHVSVSVWPAPLIILSILFILQSPKSRLQMSHFVQPTVSKSKRFIWRSFKLRIVYGIKKKKRISVILVAALLLSVQLNNHHLTSCFTWFNPELNIKSNKMTQKYKKQDVCQETLKSLLLKL